MRDRGSTSTEVAILLPIALLAIGMVVIGARIALAGQSIDGVAGTAARTASLQPDPGDAQAAATASATTALSGAGLHCAHTTVTVDTSGYSTQPGTPATVTVTVACTVDLSDIGITGLPGSRTLRDIASSPLDPARPAP